MTRRRVLPGQCIFNGGRYKGKHCRNRPFRYQHFLQPHPQTKAPILSNGERRKGKRKKKAERKKLQKKLKKQRNQIEKDEEVF